MPGLEIGRRRLQIDRLVRRMSLGFHAAGGIQRHEERHHVAGRHAQVGQRQRDLQDGAGRQRRVAGPRSTQNAGRDGLASWRSQNVPTSRPNCWRIEKRTSGGVRNLSDTSRPSASRSTAF